MAAGMIAVLMGVAAIVLQFIEYTVLDFGASQGGYAAVFFGWTATYAIVVTIVATIGLVATIIPARRITRIDPAQALRV